MAYQYIVGIFVVVLQLSDYMMDSSPIRQVGFLPDLCLQDRSGLLTISLASVANLLLILLLRLIRLGHHKSHAFHPSVVLYWHLSILLLKHVLILVILYHSGLKLIGIGRLPSVDSSIVHTIWN